MTPDLLSGVYCGPAPLPADLVWRWNADPLVLLALAVATVALRRSVPGLASVAVLTVAFVSPLCALSAALFSARVVHHVLLVAVAAPLLAMALPARPPLRATPAFIAFAVALWAWHLPPAYDFAASNKAVYWTMQASLLGAAVAFWRTALTRSGAPGRGALLILGGYMQMAPLGALLTFAPAPLYALHAVAPLAFGLSPLADQQLGGLIMWAPAGAPFLVVAGLVARRDWRAVAERPR